MAVNLITHDFRNGMIYRRYLATSDSEIERMVEDAEKNAAEDKLKMERIEAKNKVESYLYNARNSVGEEKVKEALGDSVNDVENVVKEGIEWLESHPDASKEEYEEKQKMYEDKIKPIMMK